MFKGNEKECPCLLSVPVCYNGTNIVKQISDEIRLYNYFFDTVTDEDLKIDLTNMKQVEAE